MAGDNIMDKKGQKNKQLSAKYYTENNRLSNTNPTKSKLDELWCSERIDLIFGVLAPLSVIFQLYRDDPFSWSKKPQ